MLDYENIPLSEDGGVFVPPEFAQAIMKFCLTGDGVVHGPRIDLAELLSDPQPDAIVETDKP